MVASVFGPEMPGNTNAPAFAGSLSHVSWKLCSELNGLPPGSCHANPLGELPHDLRPWITRAVEFGSDDWPGAAMKLKPPSAVCTACSDAIAVFRFGF